ncbi:hypothetical protein HG537_0D01970 [Torulaspora globosa]|uniref:OTU domain-containing protein n=1 Tax=Torulaspora globosa TaxID=48254 RepID=A0A7H9HSW2_9SACH|nr:hypothetical protein HG537_0D01970 [Torulaspora sp. CBS 2947]
MQFLKMIWNSSGRSIFMLVGARKGQLGSWFGIMEELQARHRKEVKDLQNRITGMKKQATKSTRKEVNSKCFNLQEDLRIRHEKEIRELNGAAEEIVEDGCTPEQLLRELSLEKSEQVAESEEINVQEPQRRRRNRQKERLAKRDAEIARIKEEARLEASKQPDLRKIEQDAIDQLCSVNRLKQYDIQPDGHCLFASILDQLQLRHGESARDLSVSKLRSLACEYIRQHKDDFIPYMFDEESCQLRDIDVYTEEMESTAKWGGELEIVALANQFNCPISIMMSGRPKHVIHEKGVNPELKLVYYKHTYALGEHYNSLHDDI